MLLRLAPCVYSVHMMNRARRFAPWGFGMVLAVVALKGAACSAVDPNPPNPHNNPKPSSGALDELSDGDPPDAGDAEAAP